MTMTRPSLRSLVPLLLLSGCAESPYFTIRDAQPAPPPPAADVPHQAGAFAGKDGVKLYQQSWHPAGPPRAALVIVHGLKDHSDHYAAAATALARHGYAVYSFDLRGHGRSEGHRVWVDSFEDYLGDLDALLVRVRAAEPQAPLFLFGHSMGGAIITRYTLERRPALAGLILSGPALKPGADLSSFLIAITRVLGTLTPKLAVLKLENRWFSRDPAVVAGMDQDPLVYNKPGPARTAAELLSTLRFIQDHMAALATPVLLLHGTADHLTNPDGSRELYARARAGDKTLKIYDGFYHDLLHEPEKAVVLADITRWLDAHTEPPPMRGRP